MNNRDRQFEAQKNQRLDEMFADLLTKHPTPDQLWQIVRLCEHLRDKAWAEFVKTNPSEEKLKEAMCSYGDKHVMAYPARRLIECFPEHATMMKIIEDCPENTPKLACEAARAIIAKPESRSLVLILRYRFEDKTIHEQAAKALIQLSPHQSECELTAIVQSRATESKDSAVNLLLANENLSEQLMGVIIYNAPARIPELWQKHRHKMDINTLEWIVKVRPPLSFQMDAAQAILERSNEFSPLFTVFDQCPSLREEVWKKLLTIELYEGWLEAIKRVAPEFSNRVDPLLKALETKRKLDPAYAAEVVYINILQVNSVRPLQDY